MIRTLDSAGRRREGEVSRRDERLAQRTLCLELSASFWAAALKGCENEVVVCEEEGEGSKSLRSFIRAMSR